MGLVYRRGVFLKVYFFLVIAVTKLLFGSIDLLFGQNQPEFGFFLQIFFIFKLVQYANQGFLSTLDSYEGYFLPNHCYMLTVVIIDDESKARQALSASITSFCPDIKIIGEADGVHSGLKMLEQVEPDVVFLDIQMNDGTGFDLLDRIPKLKFKVVFATAYDQFALKAFKYHAFDYLVKPIDPDDLQVLCHKLKKVEANQLSPQSISALLETMRSKNIENIALSTSEGIIFLKLKDIIRLESSGNYTIFYTGDKEKVMVSRTLGEFLDILPEDTFFRTHQSHVVNLYQVKKMLREDGGYALMSDGAKVSISRRRKEDFLEKLGKISL